MKNVTSCDGLLADLLAEGFDFFAGVPDSGLAAFIRDIEALPREMHVTATWEAEAVGLAAGAYLAGKKPCVYMQNAGLGHAVNPLASLCVPYGTPVRLVIGHRHSLPQHKVMGEIDEKLLDLLGWEDAIVVHGANNES
jgi:sulfopyruvate decarboxylase TPP-binding subunit